MHVLIKIVFLLRYIATFPFYRKGNLDFGHSRHNPNVNSTFCNNLWLLAVFFVGSRCKMTYVSKHSWSQVQNLINRSKLVMLKKSCQQSRQTIFPKSKAWKSLSIPEMRWSRHWLWRTKSLPSWHMWLNIHRRST